VSPRREALDRTNVVGGTARALTADSLGAEPAGPATRSSVIRVTLTFPVDGSGTDSDAAAPELPEAASAMIAATLASRTETTI
jgi:hypothetical protein